MAAFDLKKLSSLDRAVAGLGALTFILLFLPWYGVSAGVFSASVSGWSTSYGWLGAILIIAAGAYLVVQRSGVNLGGMPVSPAVVVFGASLLGTIIIALRWLTVPRGGIAGYSYGPRYGMIVALIAGIAQAVCAFLLFRVSGEALPWANKTQTAGAVATPQGDGTSPMPMAPPIPSPMAPPMSSPMPEAAAPVAPPEAAPPEAPPEEAG